MLPYRLLENKMNRKKKLNNKKGAASFYIVAFSTLILVIIASSFAAIIVSEITRTINDDLSQSAYDSALAGVEDAKVAFFNYQNCIKNKETYPDVLSTGPEVTCQDIAYWMNHPDCDMVSHILGRIGKFEMGEVLIQETNVANNMMQAYTCVKMDTVLDDYRSTLSSSNRSKLVRVKLDDVDADQIRAVRVNWFSDVNSDVYGGKFNYTNFSEGTHSVVFPSLTTSKAATPPTLSVQLVQTAENFNFNDFDVSVGDRTNRGTVYLVPTEKAEEAVKGNESDPSLNYNGAYNGTKNVVAAKYLVKSNDKTSKNLPNVVLCNDEVAGSYACSAEIELPKPVGEGAKRNNDTFLFVVSIPYGRPSTDFTLEFLCENACNEKIVIAEDGTEEVIETNQAALEDVQINVDSTGRANDLYRRVETRLESGDSAFPYPIYAIQLLGDGDGSLLKKDLTVTSEWNFR